MRACAFNDILWFLVAMVTVVQVTGHRRSYHGSQVLRLYTQSREHWEHLLTSLQSSYVDIWKHPGHNTWADILVSRDHATRTHDLLSSQDAPYHVIHNDIQSVIDKESHDNSHRRKRDVSSRSIAGSYATYEEIVSWMEKLPRLHPSIASTIDIGLTYEGRAMKVLKLGKRGSGKRKLSIWIDGGAHAREWISTATVVYIADKLITGYTEGQKLSRVLLTHLDWYFLPVVNPDGYVYTHTTDRLWRKNRQLFNDSGCHGIDLNRNWNYQWGDAFSSTNPCDGMFRGNSPGEAAEVKNVMDFLLARAGSVAGYVTFHSYGQTMTSRWDYSKDVLPEDDSQLMSLARKAVRKMAKVNGVMYKAGRAPEILYPYGGGSPDWAKAVAGIKYSYLIELRDQRSFILPVEEIKATAEENWVAIRLIAMEIINTWKNRTWSRGPKHVTKSRAPLGSPRSQGNNDSVIEIYEEEIFEEENKKIFQEFNDAQNINSGDKLLARGHGVISFVAFYSLALVFH